MWGLHSSRTSQQPETPSLFPVLLQDEEAEAHAEVTQFVQKSPWKAGGPKQPVHHLLVVKEGVWNRRSWRRYHLISTTGCWGVTDRITDGRGGGGHMTALSEGCWAGVWTAPCYLLPSPQHVEFSYAEATRSVCHGEGAGRTSGRHGPEGVELCPSPCLDCVTTLHAGSVERHDDFLLLTWNSARSLAPSAHMCQTDLSPQGVTATQPGTSAPTSRYHCCALWSAGRSI